MNQPAESATTNPTAGPWGFPRVAGFCPMGCGETLFIAQGGYITCSYIPCPNPSAVADILGFRETEHLVQFHAGTFTVMHPLRERVNPNDLLSCDLGEHIKNDLVPRITPSPGIYMARHVEIAPDSRLAGAATWFFDEISRDRWPIPETHVCPRCGDTYTGKMLDHLRTECPSADREPPADQVVEPVEPLLDPATRSKK